MTPIAPSGTPIVVGRFKKPAEAVFTGGPEHAISYTSQLASNVAIIYPDSRFYVQVDWICKHCRMLRAAMPFYEFFRYLVKVLPCGRRWSLDLCPNVPQNSEQRGVWLIQADTVD